MKLPTLLLTASLLASPAQEPAFSKPSGYTIQPLRADSLNIIGLPFQGRTEDSGSILKADGNHLTLSENPDRPRKPLVPGHTYLFEISSGEMEGVIQEISATSLQGNILTTPQNLSELGLKPHEAYRIRRAPLLGEVFATSASEVSRGPTPADPLSDHIWVPNGDQGYDKYFIRSTDGLVCSVATGRPAPAVPLIYSDGLIIQKRGSAASGLSLYGTVRDQSASVVIRQGMNMVGTTFAASATLQNIGFEKSLTTATSENRAKADSIWLPTATGNFDRYYFNSENSAWHNAANNQPAPAKLLLPTGIIVQRISPKPVNLKLNPPIRFSD